MLLGFNTPIEVWLFILLPAGILAIYAQTKVKTTFNKYSKINNRKGLTGEEVAKQLLLKNGITDVTVEHIRGNLSDHYDPSNKVIRLSDNVFSSTSLAGIGVAAHETGHAIQHNRMYIPLFFRTAILPVAKIGSSMAIPMFTLGFFITDTFLYLGIVLFSFALFFQVITLPIEFDASKRAVKNLLNTNILDNNEIMPVRKVLNAAALTYVAGVVSSLAQLIRLVLIANGRRD